MGQVIWTEPALADLGDIVAYVRNDSPVYAERLATRIVEAPRGLARFPQSGGIVSEFGRDDFREIFVHSYRILYRIDGPAEDCYIVAVIHGSRDLRRALRPEVEP